MSWSNKWFIKWLISWLITICFSSSFVFASEQDSSLTKHYLDQIELQNNISYQKIVNTRGAYIPAMCYTKTIDQNQQVVNPCYSCHQTGKIPNYTNDANLQQELAFPKEMLNNPYKNLFIDHSQPIKQISESEILDYIRESNYKKNNNILLAKNLPNDWPGYRPDSFFNFDKEGFDRTPSGGYTLWRAFRYYPFLGTFWPTNGSTDDVLIRLDPSFAKTKNNQQNISLYKINLAIVESLIKHKTIQLQHPINEQDYAVDLNQNGKLDVTQFIKFPAKSYVGLAQILLQQKKIHIAPGLYPENTEFLHSVRYLDWNDATNSVTLSARMKELRYAKKYRWLNYAELKTNANREFWETQTANNDEPQLALFRGNAKSGLHTNNGWILQGFIEDKIGQLRPQTKEETLYCMGCHSGIGATTDASFAFPRKIPSLENGSDWQHWSQKGLQNIAEPRINYKNNSNQYEYSFYLQNNHSANEFASNTEVSSKFFKANGTTKQASFERLHKDISTLLLPSKQRAMELNKAYKVTVKAQSFIFGREGNALPLENIFKQIKLNQKTDIVNIISP